MPFGLIRPKSNSHIKNIHPEFVKWHDHYYMRVFVWGFVVLGLMVIANFFWLEFYGLPPYGLLPYPFFLIVAYGILVILDFRRKVKRFRREWQKGHPAMPEAVNEF